MIQRNSRAYQITKYALLTASAALSIGMSRAAVASEIDISSQVNANLSTYYGGYVYPANGGPITIGGVGFDLAQYPGGGTGVVQAADGNGNSFTFAVGEADVRSVYTIINSAFGQFGSTIGSLTFTGSAGATFTYDLTEGDNVRDHASTFYNTIAPNVYATDNFGNGDRLDVQKIVLPVAFGSQTLDSITLNATGSGGDPFIAAITTSGVSAVPLPASAPMFGAALMALGAVGYGVKRKRASAA